MSIPSTKIASLQVPLTARTSYNLSGQSPQPRAASKPLCISLRLDAQGIAAGRRASCRKFHLQSVPVLAPVQLSIRAEQRHALDFSRSAQSVRREAMDANLSVRRPLHPDGKDRCIFCCEAKILGGVGLNLGIVKCAADDLRRTLAEALPGPSSVDCLAVYLQPGAHLAEDLLRRFGNSAVRSRADIQQQISILAYHIRQLLNDEVWSFVRVVFDVAPGRIAE